MPSGRPRGKSMLTGWTTFCRNGHAMTKENMSIRKRKQPNGDIIVQARCRLCRNASVSRYRRDSNPAIDNVIRKERDRRPPVTAMDIAQRRKV